MLPGISPIRYLYIAPTIKLKKDQMSGFAKVLRLDPTVRDDGASFTTLFRELIKLMGLHLDFFDLINYCHLIRNYIP